MLRSRTRVIPKDAFYKVIDPDTGLGLRVTPGARPRLDRLDICTWFVTREQAEQCVAAHIGPSTLEVVRIDS